MALAFSDQEVPSGVINGVNPVFTLLFAPSPALSLIVTRNGLAQSQGVDFTLSANVITFLSGSLPLTGDGLVAWYRYNTPSTLSGFGPTVDDLFRSSFRCINQLRPGFGHSPSERVDALFILNAMLESWGLDDLNCYCELIQSFPLVGGQGTYTIGPGGDFNTTRPIRIDKATLVVLTNPASPLRIDMELIDAEQWQLISLQSTPSTLPTKLFYNPTFTGQGCGFIGIWPVNTGPNNVEISSSQALSSGFTDGATVFSAPPGYLDAVRYNLAVRLAMEWNQPLKPGVEALASESLAKVQRRNATTPQMDVNPAVLPMRQGRSGFNYRIGD